MSQTAPITCPECKCSELKVDLDLEINLEIGIVELYFGCLRCDHEWPIEFGLNERIEKLREHVCSLEKAISQMVTVHVRGGVAYCDNPYVKIIDHDNDESSCSCSSNCSCQKKGN